MPKYRLLAPGPVAVPERVRLAMAGALPHHRSPEFLPILAEVRAGLAEVFQTVHEVLVLASSGTGGMEAAVVNVLAPGDCAVVVRAGKFGERWAELCESYGIDVEPVDVEYGSAVAPEAVARAFAARPEARALLVQASETSTGVYHPIEALAEVVHHKEGRLVIVDGISAVGVHDLPMDRWGLDVVVSGSQKGWLIPPGLSFVALSERAQAAVRNNSRGRYYFDLRKELDGQPQDATAYTPAISLILGLREALQILREEGLPRVFARHRDFAQATRAAAEALGLEPYTDSPSHACTSIRVPASLAAGELIQLLRDRYGIAIEGGRGPAKGKIIRIGHLGDLDAFDVVTAVSALEMALTDLGYPAKLGEGTRAALEVLHEHLTRSESWRVS